MVHQRAILINVIPWIKSEGRLIALGIEKMSQYSLVLHAVGAKLSMLRSRIGLVESCIPMSCGVLLLLSYYYVAL